MKASKFKTRVWNGIVIAASVLVLAFVLVAPGVTTPRSAGHVSALGASAYGGRSYAVGTYVPLLGGTIFADTGDLPCPRIWCRRAGGRRSPPRSCVRRMPTPRAPTHGPRCVGW